MKRAKKFDLRSHPVYYRRDGTPIWYGTSDEDMHKATFEWAALIEHKNNHVADSQLPNGIRVSTIYIGLDHGMPWSGTPQIFESMAFAAELSVHKASEGSIFTQDFAYHKELDCERYATEAQALAGHLAMCEKWFAGSRLLPWRDA
jgi:hypothetical protein